MAESGRLILPDPDATRDYGRRLAGAIQRSGLPGLIVYLQGELGAGKTTLARGFLEGLGHSGRVPSPTYTLVEPYVLSHFRVYHIDLYRIRVARELDELDLAEQLSSGAVGLIEWPDHGTGHLPPADVRISLQVHDEGRALIAEGLSAAGRAALAELS